MDQIGIAQAASARAGAAVRWGLTPHPLGRVTVGVVAFALACAVPALAADEPKEKARPAADEPKGSAEPLDVGPTGKPQAVAVDLKRLGTELDLYAAEANRNRLASALIGLGVGSVLVPTGLLLRGRTDGASRALVTGMIVSGSAQLVSVPLQLIPTRMDEIRDEFIGRPANVESKATIREIENEWREAAESSHRKRIWVGTTLFSVGSASLATGLVLLLAPVGILEMSRNTQYTWGGVTMGFAVPVITLSVRLLFEWSLEETSWAAYRTMKSDAANLAQLRLRQPSIGVAPMAGGALAIATVPF